jgi:preprotein translocase SecE subunit
VLLSPRNEEHIQFGLRRYGQGYWVRVMTAVFAGMLVLGGAIWLANLSQLIELPNSAWTMGLANMTGEFAPGTAVTLTDAATPPGQIASGVVQTCVVSRWARRGRRRSGRSRSPRGKYLSDAKAMSWSVSGSTATAGVGSQTGIPIFNPTYLRLGIAIAVIIAGAVLVYWLVGRRTGSVDFLVAVDGEMKKVNWSTKRIIQNSTTVVILASFFIAGALFAIDYLLGSFFQLIGVMPK